MPDWIFWVVFGWLMFAVVGRRRAGFGCSSHGRQRRITQRQDGAAQDELAGTPRADLPTQRASLEELEERLRARYVSGELSVEQYERELDRLYTRG